MAGIREVSTSEFTKIYALEHPPVIRSLEIITGLNFDDGIIPKGTIVGKITATGTFRPLTVTALSGTVTAATTIYVDDPEIFKATDVLTISTSTTTVVSVNTTTQALVVTPAISGADDATVSCDDGAQTDYAITVMDVDTESAADGVPCLVHGIAYTDYVWNKQTTSEANLIGKIWFIDAI